MMCAMGIPSGELTSPLLAVGTFESILFQTSPYSKIWVILFRVTGTETPFIIIFWSPTPRKGLPAYQKIRNRHPKPSTYWGFTPVKACTGRPDLKVFQNGFSRLDLVKFRRKKRIFLFAWLRKWDLCWGTGWIVEIFVDPLCINQVENHNFLRSSQGLPIIRERETQFWALRAPTPIFLNIRQRYSTRFL